LHTESDLRIFLRWCTDQDLDSLATVQVDVERFVRWLQDAVTTNPGRPARPQGQPSADDAAVTNAKRPEAASMTRPARLDIDIT
jgi:hypothetical protein